MAQPLSFDQAHQIIQSGRASFSDLERMLGSDIMDRPDRIDVLQRLSDDPGTVQLRQQFRKQLLGQQEARKPSRRTFADLSREEQLEALTGGRVPKSKVPAVAAHLDVPPAISGGRVPIPNPALLRSLLGE